MILWAAIGALTVACVATLLLPFWRRPRGHASDPTQDVFADQLAEIDADLKAEAIDPAQAESARVEIARRILAPAPAAPAPVTTRSIALPAAIVLSVAVGSVGLYLCTVCVHLIPAILAVLAGVGGMGTLAWYFLTN